MQERALKDIKEKESLYSLSLCIADVVIKVVSPFKISIERQDKSYKDFIEKSCKSEYDILAEIPNKPLSRWINNEKFKLFESGESWSLYKKKDDYYIIYFPPAFKEPLLVAEAKDEFSKVRISCSGEYLERRDRHLYVFNPVSYPLDQIIMIHYLANRDGILIHSAGIKKDERGYLFPGISGAGKSTLSSMICESDYEYNVLSDDRIIIRRKRDFHFIYGTPWAGEGGLAINESACLKGIFFIEKGDRNEIVRIKEDEAFRRIMLVVSIPWYEKGFITGILDFCDSLISMIPSYVFRFKISKDVVEVFDEFVNREI